MIPRLQEPPKWFLSEEVCKNIYEAFKERISFHEPLPTFESQIPHQLESILYSVSGSFDGQPFCPTILDAAATYYYKLACGQVFANGNKRLSILYTDFYLWTHNIGLEIPQERFYLLTVELASLSERKVPHSIIRIVARKIIEEHSTDLKK